MEIRRILPVLILFWLPIFISAQSLDGLVASYPLNGNGIDVSGNMNNGRLEGTEEAVDRFGLSSSSLSFNGVDDRIVVYDSMSLRLQPPFAIVAWVNPDTVKSSTIIRKGLGVPGVVDPYYMVLSGTNNIAFGIRTDSTFVSVIHPQYNIDQWQLLVGSVTMDSVFLFVDGHKVGQVAYKGDIEYDGSALLIGSRTRQIANTFSGRIDDVKLYDRALSETEIMDLFLQQCPDYIKLSNRTIDEHQSYNARFRIELDSVILESLFGLSLTSPDILIGPGMQIADSADLLIISESGCN